LFQAPDINKIKIYFNKNFKTVDSADTLKNALFINIITFSYHGSKYSVNNQFFTKEQLLSKTIVSLVLFGIATHDLQ
jgi:hypothetical protein